MKNILKTIILTGIIQFPLSLMAQKNPEINATVSGKIIDLKTNEVLIGANVTIKGTTNGSKTDVNG